MRPTYTEIDLANLRYNLKQIKSLLPPHGQLLNIVKANAYGHGAIAITRELEKAKEKYFGVATVQEALELRRSNIQSHILILGSFYESDIDDIFWHKLTPVCYRKDHLEYLNQSAKSAQTKFSIHVKFDTGMGRLGFEWNEAKKIADLLLGYENLVVEGLMSHLSSAEEVTDYNELQLKRFNEIKKVFKSKKISPEFFHVSNSSAILRKLDLGSNLFRPGIALYGAYTDRSLKDCLNLKQLMTLKSEITQIKDLETGSPVSYGRKFITDKKTSLAVLPIGYADGYSRRLSNLGKVIIKGQWAPVRGSVCMDMLVVDVSSIKGVKVGDVATLLGYDNGNCITINDMAEQIAALPYEITCGISERVIRSYKNESEITHSEINS